MKLSVKDLCDKVIAAAKQAAKADTNAEAEDCLAASRVWANRASFTLIIGRQISEDDFRTADIWSYNRDHPLEEP